MHASSTTMPNLDDLLGVPYVRGGRDAKAGLDCWGVLREVYRRLDVELPEIDPANYADPTEYHKLWVPAKAPYQFPDIVVSERKDHQGVAVLLDQIRGTDTFAGTANRRLLSADPDRGVCIVRLCSVDPDPYKVRFYRIRDDSPR